MGRQSMEEMLDTHLLREFREWAGTYEADTARLNYAGHTRVVEKILNLVKDAPPRNPTIVDLGTGTGLVIRGLRDVMRDATFHAYDYAREMLDQCRQKNPGAKLVQWDLQKAVWPTAPESADIVTSSGLMDFIKDPQRFLINTQVLMKPGAVAALTYEVQTTIKKGPFMDYSGRYPQFFHHMQDMAESAGLHVVEHERFPGYVRYGNNVPYGMMTLRKPAP